MAGYDNSYAIQERIFLFFWYTRCSFLDLDYAEFIFGDYIKSDKIKRENPRNVTIKEH